LISNTLLANTPQILVSTAYVTYNGLITSMGLVSEFSDYAHERKPLRVSPRKKGSQRSTYCLQIPLRYSLPLMVYTAVLHWLISQSIFLVHVNTYDIMDREHTDGFINACGYSVQAIIITLLFGGLMITFPFILGTFSRYPKGIPLVRHNSLAIASACHPPKGEPWDSAERPLKYGVYSGQESGPVRKRVGFSALEVEPLVDGEVYECENCAWAIRHPMKKPRCCNGTNHETERHFANNEEVHRIDSCADSLGSLPPYHERGSLDMTEREVHDHI